MCFGVHSTTLEPNSMGAGQCAVCLWPGPPAAARRARPATAPGASELGRAGGREVSGGGGAPGVGREPLVGEGAGIRQTEGEDRGETPQAEG